MNKVFLFNEPLIEAIILKRKSQFTIVCNINEEIINCHCPTTGRIGDVEIKGLPCLLSKSNDPKRKIPYTVEAVSLDNIEDKNKSWIGINQNSINRYVEYFLVNGEFKNMIDVKNVVKREQFLGKSKLDFFVENTYLEVKMPLQSLQIEYPKHVKTKKVAPFSSTDRFQKHIEELGNSLSSNERAILLTCFIYDNPGFEVIEKSTNYQEVRDTVNKSLSLGLEIWQANFEINLLGVKLTKYFKLNMNN